jgi:hypothetical protein
LSWLRERLVTGVTPSVFAGANRRYYPLQPGKVTVEIALAPLLLDGAMIRRPNRWRGRLG